MFRLDQLCEDLQIEINRHMTDFSDVRNFSLVCRQFELCSRTSSSCLKFITDIDPRFTIQNLQYCVSDTSINNRQLVRIFLKLYNMPTPITSRLHKFIRDLSIEKQAVVFKLMLCSNILFQKFSSPYQNKGSFICLFSSQFKMVGDMFKFLFDECCCNSFNSLMGEDLYKIARRHGEFLRSLLIERPIAARLMLRVVLPHEITRMLQHYKDKFSLEDLNKIANHQYSVEFSRFLDNIYQFKNKVKQVL